MKTLGTMLIVARELLKLYGFSSGFRRIFSGGWLLLQAQRYRKGWVWSARRAHCKECDLYNAKLDTCGSPGESYFDHETKRLESLGCWCILHHAARLPKKDCWARANKMDFGWPDNLRPKEK